MYDRYVLIPLQVHSKYIGVIKWVREWMNHAKNNDSLYHTSAPLPGGWAGNGVTRRARPEGRQECLSRYPHPDGNSPGSVK
jgi:hypothetical protein